MPVEDVPSTVEEWSAAVLAEGIESRPLEKIADDGSFSGSTMGFRPFLQLRPLWLEELKPRDAHRELQAAGLVSSEDLKLAGALQHRMLQSDKNQARGLLQGLVKVKSFIETLAALYGKKKMTPLSILNNECGGDTFGAFASTLYHLSNLRSIKPPEGQTGNDYSPKVVAPDRPRNMNTAASPPRPDYSQPVGEPMDVDSSFSTELDSSPSGESQGSPSVQLQIRRAARNAQASGADKTEDTVSPTAQAQAPAPAESAESAEAAPRPVPRPLIEGRTEYEIQTSHFFFSFMAATYLQIFPFHRNPVVSARPEERGYHLCRDGRLGDGPEARWRLYTSRPDGSFRAADGKPFAYFELKPFKRMPSAKRTIQFEETAEMAAIIYREAVQGLSTFV